MSPRRPARSRAARRLARGLLMALPWAPTLAAAWPAIQDGSGFVYLCDSRPAQLSDGRWSCRSGPGSYAGTLLEVARPGLPPGTRSYDLPRDAPYRYVPYPWGPPPREPSGYDALDPWLGPRGTDR